MTASIERRTVSVGSTPLRIEDVVDLAYGRARAVVDDDEGLRARIAASQRMVDDALSEGRTVYGVTTGYGASAEHTVDPSIAEALPLNLLRYHGCGTGARLGALEGSAVVATRLASLSRGYSGVRLELLERLCELLDRRLAPVIPAEGSVGASGDLTPLSYLAALVVGEREVWSEGHCRDAAEVLAEGGLEPLTLRPKEGLALLNGTAVMTALGALAFDRATRLARLAAALTALASDVLLGEPGHFHERIFALKPHPGQARFGAWVRAALSPRGAPIEHVQDPYSLRCAPHVGGLLLDALPFCRQLLETEINGVNDNPLLDPESGLALHGGNFYGGHACLATDTLKNVVANVADLLERQLVLLNNPRTSRGLPPNLVARQGDDRFTHHGFKAMEITASALTAEALKLAAPASVFSRSTESHNQDKVSMGTISAREALRVLELAETVAIIHLLALCQGVDLRGPEHFGPAPRRLFDAVRAVVPKNDADRRMDVDIDAALALYRAGGLPIEPAPLEPTQ